MHCSNYVASHCHGDTNLLLASPYCHTGCSIHQPCYTHGKPTSCDSVAQGVIPSTQYCRTLTLEDYHKCDTLSTQLCNSLVWKGQWCNSLVCIGEDSCAIPWFGDDSGGIPLFGGDNCAIPWFGDDAKTMPAAAIMCAIDTHLSSLYSYTVKSYLHLSCYIDTLCGQHIWLIRQNPPMPCMLCS